MQSARWRGTTGPRKRRADGRSVDKPCPKPSCRSDNIHWSFWALGAHTYQFDAQQFHGEKELFKSEHVDPIAASTITGKCRVLTLKQYQVRPPAASVPHRGTGQARTQVSTWTDVGPSALCVSSLGDADDDLQDLKIK